VIGCRSLNPCRLLADYLALRYQPRRPRTVPDAMLSGCQHYRYQLI